MATIPGLGSRSDSASDSDSKFGLGADNNLFLVLGIVLIGALGYFSHKFADMIAMLNGVSTIILLMGFIVASGIVILGFMNLINNMYMSSDIEILITMPFSSIQIAVLRVLSFFRLALAASLAFMIAPCVGYALVYPLSVSEWFAVILTAILLPIFATAITAALVILLMSVLKIFRSREVLKVIGTCFLFVLLCVYMFFSSSDKKIDAGVVIQSSSSILNTIKYSVPIVGFAIDYITKANVLYLLLELVSTVAASILFFVIAKVMYLQGAMSMQDAGGGKRLTEKMFDHYCKKNPVMKALMAKEYRMVRRNPVYLLYNFIVGALWPILVIILFKQLIPVISDLMTDEDIISFTQVISFDAWAIYTAIITISILFIVSIPLGMQTIAYSSLSREGKSFPIMKQLPVSYQIQIEAKRRVAATIAQISVTGYSILILIVVAILLKIPFLYCIVPLIITAIYVELHTNIDMWIGIRYANVSWDDEKSAAKKPLIPSLISIAGMFIFMGLAGLIIFGLFLEILNIVMCFGIVFACALIMVILNILLRRAIATSGEKKIRKMRF